MDLSCTTSNLWQWAFYWSLSKSFRPWSNAHVFPRRVRHLRVTSGTAVLISSWFTRRREQTTPSTCSDVWAKLLIRLVQCLNIDQVNRARHRTSETRENASRLFRFSQTSLRFLERALRQQWGCEFCRTQNSVWLYPLLELLSVCFEAALFWLKQGFSTPCLYGSRWLKAVRSRVSFASSKWNLLCQGHRREQRRKILCCSIRPMKEKRKLWNSKQTLNLKLDKNFYYVFVRFQFDLPFISVHRVKAFKFRPVVEDTEDTHDTSDTKSDGQLRLRSKVSQRQNRQNRKAHTKIFSLCFGRRSLAHCKKIKNK